MTEISLFVMLNNKFTVYTQLLSLLFYFTVNTLYLNLKHERQIAVYSVFMYFRIFLVTFWDEQTYSEKLVEYALYVIFVE